MAIRVGRRVYNTNGSYTDPSYDGFEDILCLTKSSRYGSIGPYVLKDTKNRIMENVWQFSKIYETVPRSKQAYSRYDRRIIWDHEAETHAVKNQDGLFVPTLNYKLWRQKGMKCADAVRYPVGFSGRSKCIGVITSSEYNKCVADDTYAPKLLNYIDARKEIYLKIYTRLVKSCPHYKTLLEKLKKGTNILIIEVDGPHGDSLDYYKNKYGVKDDFIENNTILVTQENMDIMLNDEKYPFGHGYALGLALFKDL